MALHLSDFLLRRTDLAAAGPPPEAALENPVSAMASALSWDERKILEERASVGSVRPLAAVESA
jgi:glycerol-3-phosphate dehydrogenase